MPEPMSHGSMARGPTAGTPGRRIVVLDPGALTTVQDRGRAGFAHLGVPRSGAADMASYELANRLVGNEPGAACLETTLTGCTVRVTGAARFAVTGAGCEVRVDGRAVPWGTAVSVPAGSELRLGPATVGLRCYLAVAGGIAVPPVLGSRATDTLSGLGPEVLAAGDALPLGLAGEPAEAVEIGPPGRAGEVVLSIDLGPRADWFVDPGRLDGTGYVVAPDSNRIGVRLQGPGIERARHGELESEPMVLGAVQVPASGQPLVLLADHATTGGYPVLGVVRDVAGLAQARPGERVILRLAH